MGGEQTYTIRRAQPSDALALYKMYALPHVVWGTLGLPFPSPEDWEQRLSGDRPGLVMLVALQDTFVIGNISIQAYATSWRRRHAGRLGMAVHDEWQGHGVGTALMDAAIDLADNWLNIRRLELEVFTDNEPAIRLYQKFDFVVEGTLREYAYRDGRYVDVYAMARFRTARSEDQP